MVSTITFSVGEATMADSVDSARAPPAYMPLAIGAAQFTHTPSGAPIAMPSSGVGERIAEADAAQIAEQREERGAE